MPQTRALTRLETTGLENACCTNGTNRIIGQGFIFHEFYERAIPSSPAPTAICITRLPVLDSRIKHSLRHDRIRGDFPLPPALPCLTWVRNSSTPSSRDTEAKSFTPRWLIEEVCTSFQFIFSSTRSPAWLRRSQVLKSRGGRCMADY
jgi:hypothetical protein